MGEALQLGKLALVHPQEPGIQELPIALPHHREKILNKLVRFLKRRSSPTKSCQMFLLKLLQLVWMAHEQRDRRCRGVVRRALTSYGSFDLMCFEGFQEARVPSAGSPHTRCRCNFLPEVRAVALPFFPAFEHVWRVGIEIALTFAPWPDIRSHSSLEPM